MICVTCGYVGPASDFPTYKNKKRKKPYQQKHCRLCVNARCRKWREKEVAKDPLWYVREHFKRTYGLTLEQWEAKFEAQGRRCAVCRCTTPRKFKWCIDHNHTTGEIRDILCHPCNAAFGMMDENPAFIQNLAAYAEKYT